MNGGAIQVVQLQRTLIAASLEIKRLKRENAELRQQLAQALIA